MSDPSDTLMLGLTFGIRGRTSALLATTLALTALPDQAPDASWADWTELRFEERGRTDYTLTELDGLPCMRAVAQDGASALVREVGVDLQNMPVLRWSWRAQEGVKTLDISQKAGDDLTARVTVNFALDSDRASLWERLRYRIARMRYGDRLPGSAITYGWANLEPPGTIEPNAYTDRVLTVILRNTEHVGRGWFDEERNVLEDYRRLFGEEPPSVVGIGIMTDTDDGGGRADACYSDIFFGG